MRRLLSSLPVLRCSVERMRLEGSVPRTAGEERTVRNGRFRSCVHCRRGRCPRPAHGPCSLGARPARIGCCSTSFTLALLSEDVSGTLCEPLIAALTAWVTLSYAVCGLVAWWRRPANRFGPLLIIAGSSTSFRRWSGRAETSCALLGRRSTWCRRFSSCTSFWHFPDGRLKGRFVRSFVATAYVVAIALELVRMSAGDFGPHNSSRARKHQVKVSIADAQARLHGRYPSIGSVSSRDARSTARATWIRDDTSSLRKMLRMCDSTVL